MNRRGFIISLAVLSTFLYSLGCENGHKRNAASSDNVKYTIDGRFLVKETYDSIGRLRVKQYFNKDTVPDGAMSVYFPNGRIVVWRWFRAKHKNPDFGIFYKQDGSYDTMKGSPFLGFGFTPENYPVIKAVNPPQIKFAIGYRETYMDKTIKNTLFYPFSTDTISWSPLLDYKYKKGHKYMIYFDVVDSVKGKILYSDSMEFHDAKELKER